MRQSMFSRTAKWCGRISALALASSFCAAQPILADAPEAPSMVRQAPKGAPNILVVLLDDVGFGTASTFGGPVPTPVLDSLARQGLSYTRFHTTSICSPTRSSLLTGSNPHATGIGAVMNSIDARPGYSGFHTKDTATIAEVLRQNGYATAAIGKWHQTPDWEASQVGPFDRWPTGEGFEYFYGFQGGETDQYDPTLYEGTKPVMRPAVPGYHLGEDLARHGADWLRAHKSVKPGQPFFLYFAASGIHAPIQAPRDWIDRFKGKFDRGWDKLREETFARQKASGLFPAAAELPPRPAQIPAWDSLSSDQKRFSARLMEAYAGFLAHTDAQVGKIVDELKASGDYDNTLIFYVVGDNGASLEGGPEGSLNYMAPLLGLRQSNEGRMARIGDVGSKEAYAHLNIGWSLAANAPFRWGKAMPAWLGAIRNPLVVSWPKGIGADFAGGKRGQFGHVNDIAPTILDVLGLPAPRQVGGVVQRPMDGTSLAYSFAAPAAAERHTTQYFEVFGSRAIYHNGWFASADHGRLPWTPPAFMAPPIEKDQWQLFDLRADPIQAQDVSQQEPQMLAQLQQLFMDEAARNNVLPLKGQVLVKTGLPSLSAGRTSISYRAGTSGVPESALPPMANRSWRIEASFTAGKSARGVIGAVGGSSAGWSLWLDAARRPNFTYRLFDIQTLRLVARRPLAPGNHNLTADFTYDGGGFAKGGRVALSLDGQPVGEGRLEASTPQLLTIDETFDVGIDRGSPVDAYPRETEPGFAFRGGEIDKVTVSLPGK